MSYGHLSRTEKAHWNEYQGLRRISDWPGFDDLTRADADAARTWLVEQRKNIWRAAQPKADGGDGKGWTANDRRERWEFLKDENLNIGAPKHEVRLPTPGSATDAEKAYLEAREIYLALGSATPEQKARKQRNVDWLVERRKLLWHLMATDQDRNRSAGREARYDALCIATHHGNAYEEWDKAHNKWGVPFTKEDVAKGQRAEIIRLALSFVGTSEHPAGSNRGTPQPSMWQKRVVGSDGWAWCACFTTCMCWDAGVEGQSTAGVWNNIQLAKQGKGMFRAYTTDPSRVRMGDHVIIGCETCHTELVKVPPKTRADVCKTVGGNTAPKPGSGDEYNGGTVAERDRSPREVVGYLLIRAKS